MPYDDSAGVYGTNPQTTLLPGHVDRSNLYPVSLSSMCTNPGYTYSSGTTIDYIFASIVLASRINGCSVIESSDDLNVSDHLALSICLDLDVAPARSLTSKEHKIDWTDAVRNGHIDAYVCGVNEIVNDSISQLESTSPINIEEEIISVATKIVDLAKSALPQRRTRGRVFVFVMTS